MSLSKAARFSKTEPSAQGEARVAASLEVATLVEFKSEHEALLKFADNNVTASILQSASADIAAQGLRAPFQVLVGRVAGAHGQYIVISPASGPAVSGVTATPTEKLVLSAQSAIELRCGDSLITLTKDGKITIRGIDVRSRAARTCIIKGATVSIN
mgnify:CR=1 FL=1